MENTRKTMAVITIGLYFTLTAASPAKSSTTDQSLCDQSLEDQNLPHPSDCSRYYRCVYGKKVPKECPEKMLFNPSIGNCDLYYNVECDERVSDYIDDDDLREETSLAQAIENLTGRAFAKTYASTTSESDETSAERNGVTNTKYSESSTNKFVYLPHDDDQKAYYKIENGERLLLYCDEGKVFSFDLEICANPWDFQ